MIVTLLAGCTGCSPAVVGTARQAKLEPQLLVFAAASLTEVFRDLQAEFQRQHPETEVQLHFAGSPLLVAQILAGAEADLLASADAVQAQRLVDAGKVAGAPVVFATNRLALIAPAKNQAVQQFADLTKSGVRVVLAGPAVPVGQYARNWLRAELGEAALQQIEQNLVSREDNVKLVLMKVRLGEADAGVVYVSDLTAAAVDEVRTIATQPTAIATYPIVLLNASPHPQAAAAWRDLLLSEVGRQLLQQHQLGVP